MKTRILEFGMYDEVYNPIVPMKAVIPEWYKSINRFDDGSKEPSLNPPNIGVKHCMPYMDSLLTGYALPAPVDLLVEPVDGKIQIKAKMQGNFIAARSDQDVPAPPGFNTQQFAWQTQVAMRIPDGYSLLITHPLNRVDLPFYTLSGIVDGPYDMQNGNLPFYIRKGFTGIIEAGTPVAQIIPFKRESWKAENNPSVVADAEINYKLSAKYIYGWYKKFMWKRKEYN